MAPPPECEELHTGWAKARNFDGAAEIFGRAELGLEQERTCTYDAQTGTGKTTAQTDTYRGRFVKLAPDQQVVEAVELETTDTRAARRDDDHHHALRR